MVRNDEFRALAVGDAFYKGSVRYSVEAIQHRIIQPNPNYLALYEAVCRTRTKKSVRRRGQIIVETGYVTFLNLRPSGISRIVKADKVRKTREYKTRKDYPFVKTVDTCELEASENNDCTVRALSITKNIPYTDAHAHMAKHGRKPKHGHHCEPAYGAYGLKYRILCGYTFGSLLKSGLLPERSIVRTRGHVQAVINGVVHDTGRIGKNSKVKGYFYVNHS